MTTTITATWVENMPQDFRAPIEAKVFGPYPDNTWDVELYVGTDVMNTITVETLDNLLEQLAPHIEKAKADYLY